jgi:hypothetical protein
MQNSNEILQPRSSIMAKHPTDGSWRPNILSVLLHQDGLKIVLFA